MKGYIKLLGLDTVWNILKYVFSFLAVMVIGSVLILWQGENPVTAMTYILEGSFGSIRNFGNTLRWITPCILTGIAATVAFKSGVMNLGIEGQLYFGAYAAALFGFYVHLPRFLHVPSCLLAAGIAGMAFALIPALMKLFFNVNEMITTLMLNYIAVLLTEYFTYIVMGISAAGDSLALSTPPIQDTARLTNLVVKTNASTGFVIAVTLVVIIFMVYRYTIVGYELKQVGENRRFSKVGGVNVTWTFLAIFLLSGFLAGLCGSIEVQGTYGKFTASFSNNLGWDGIMIAMIGNTNPLTVLVVAIVWGILKAGSLHMERMCDVNRLTVLLIQALFVLFITVDYRTLFNYFKRKGAIE
ncbi:MAG: ABC transporter permease [Eubacteriales bacterium]|nr:ABC transporter permease [Eubacteriales bacterium]